MIIFDIQRMTLYWWDPAIWITTIIMVRGLVKSNTNDKCNYCLVLLLCAF